jgi:CheY-like chemotaxis protein
LTPEKRKEPFVAYPCSRQAPEFKVMNDDDPDPRISARLVKRVQDMKGGREKLAEHLEVHPNDVAQWIAARSFPPQAVFEKVLEILLEAHDKKFSAGSPAFAAKKNLAQRSKPRVLLADSPEACAVLGNMLSDELALIPAHSFADAVRVLEGGPIDLIVCGQHFDGSQMFRFLEHVKADGRARDIPFICCRALPTKLRGTALAAMREACEALGALAYVDLPEIAQKEGSEAAAVEFRDAVKAAVDFAPAKQPIRILVADDNQDSLHTLSVLLEMAGHEVQKAKDGTEALKIAAVFKPDVMVLDIGMPKVSGYAVAKRARTEPWGEAVVLIALTGSGQRAEIERAFRSGFDHHFRKPVKLEHLLEVFPP